MATITRPTTPRTRGGADTRHHEYQELKSRIHQQLLNRLNLERLTTIKREDAEPEIRVIIQDMLERESEKMPIRRVIGIITSPLTALAVPMSPAENCWLFIARGKPIAQFT